MSETVRSFIAFDIDDASVLGRIGELQRLLIESGADLKLVKPENVHITVRFLGNITLGMVDSCLLYTSPSPRDAHESRMPSSA